MIALNISDIVKICVAEAYNVKDGSKVTSITTDSRAAKKEGLFAAISGERTDGHKYIAQAVQNGASAVICEKKPDEDIDAAVIVVPSTLKALQQIAAYIREVTKIPVIGIGGSVGKTSTKECIASVAAQKYSVLKTEGNFNNELGLPLTIFNISEENNMAVLEMGISDFGEMHLLASIAKPDICVLTNIGDCHLEFLGDRDGVLKAKSEMFDFIGRDGHIVLNGDDSHLSTIKDVKGIKPVLFGFAESNDVWCDNIKGAGIMGSYCDIHTEKGSITVRVPKPGGHMIMNALAATAVGLIIGLTLEEIKSGIEEQESVPGRFHVTKKDGITVIDDCYNANPMSMKASLKALSESEGRKVAILGDMGELGENEIRFHREVGQTVAELGIDELCCVGKLSSYIAEEAAKDEKLEVKKYDELKRLIDDMKNIVKSGDVVLVKASHFMGFEAVVSAILTQSEK